jgi:mannosyltransferase OCH1-like enzyme
MYVDFDYECFEPFDDYLSNEKKCYFAMEAKEHRPALGNGTYFNNALMATSPGHLFFESIITNLQKTPFEYTESKFNDVMYSTGPLMLTDLYEKYENKSSIDFFPSEKVSPWSKEDVVNYINKNADVNKLEKKMEKAIAIHYFFGSWL